MLLGRQRERRVAVFLELGPRCSARSFRCLQCPKLSTKVVGNTSHFQPCQGPGKGSRAVRKIPAGSGLQ